MSVAPSDQLGQGTDHDQRLFATIADE
jgi:hypothetical protein